jgi:lysophospholipase L1-like esterase
MATPPTIAVSASSDASLVATNLCTGGVLAPATLNQIAWYGGIPTPILSLYVCLPVASVLPSTNGNIGSGMLDKNQWASAFEIMTDSDKVQFGIYISSAAKVMFQVDGQYVDFAGTAGNNAANTDTFFELTFASRKTRRIRVLLPNVPSKGCTLVKSIRVSPTCSFWKPPQSEVLRLAWAGDSYSEGTNGAASIYPIPNAAWPVLTGELLGIRDVRQVSVGSCGYISDNAGARSKLRDQIPRWANQGPFDLIVFANGYNDSSSTPYAIQTEVLADLQLVSTLHPSSPIVVLGCQAGAAGPSAAQIATENAIAAAVKQFNYPLCKFAPVSTDTPTWLNGTGYVGATNGTGNSDVYVDPDHTHPTIAGAEYLAYRSAAAIRMAVLSML